MTVVEPRRPSVSAAQSIPTYYRMLLRGQLTKGRMVGLGVLGGISLLLAVVTRTSAEQVDLEEVSVALLSAYSISLLIPLAALILASPMIGNLVEDRLLVYLWLKPVPRWHLAVAAYAAVVTTLAPVVVLPVVATAAVTGFGSLIVPATAAAILGVLAYSAIYLFLGARFTAGLWLGLLYLVLWENVVSRFGSGMARLSIRSYLQTMLQRGTDVPIDLADRASWASIVIPLVVAVAAVGMTAVTLSRKDID
jgi:ABC-2 type transport system permease protein